MHVIKRYVSKGRVTRREANNISIIYVSMHTSVQTQNYIIIDYIILLCPVIPKLRFNASAREHTETQPFQHTSKPFPIPDCYSWNFTLTLLAMSNIRNCHSFCQEVKRLLWNTRLTTVFSSPNLEPDYSSLHRHNLFDSF
jgi:hypothetical protein